ncbi:MAG: hypothetical protein QXT74_02795 [Candidatus Nezhaarchaeales archaeon]
MSALRRRLNPIGLVAAGLMLALAASKEAPWWVLSVGEVAAFQVSPFKVSLEVLGCDVVPSVVDYLTLGAWLSVLVGAVLMAAGSLSRRGWSKALLSFGLSKIAWGLSAVIIVAALPYLLASSPLRDLLLSYAASLLGARVLSAEGPLLVGEGALRLAVAGLTVTLPLRAYVTQYFYAASACLCLCIAARLYQRRVVAIEGAELQLQEPPKRHGAGPA